MVIQANLGSRDRSNAASRRPDNRVMEVRKVKKGILVYGRWLLAGLVSVGLLSWLAWRVSVEKLAEAAAALNWPMLAGLTLLLVLALYGWDTLCVRWLFGQPQGGL